MHSHLLDLLQMSLLRIKDGKPVSVGDIVGSVEAVEGKVSCYR